jgi:hypothetical protein
LGFAEDWQKFLAENWAWFTPMVAMLTGPLLASLATILYDYMKMKGLIK